MPFGQVTSRPLYSGAAPGTGWAVAVVPEQNFQISILLCSITQLGGGGSLQMGVYDYGTLNFIALTAAAPISLGVNVGAIAPISLNAGQAYYFAIWSNSNGSRMDAGNYAGGAAVQRIEMNNVGFLPANLGPYIGNQRTIVPYIGAVP